MTHPHRHTHNCKFNESNSSLSLESYAKCQLCAIKPTIRQAKDFRHFTPGGLSWRSTGNMFGISDLTAFALAFHWPKFACPSLAVTITEPKKLNHELKETTSHNKESRSANEAKGKIRMQENNGPSLKRFIYEYSEVGPTYGGSFVQNLILFTNIITFSS